MLQIEEGPAPAIDEYLIFHIARVFLGAFSVNCKRRSSKFLVSHV